MATIIGEGNSAVTLGARTVAALAANRQVKQFEPGIVQVSEDVAPLTRLLEKLHGRKTVNSMTFYHLTGDVAPRTVTHAAETSNAGVTTINLATNHGNRLRVGDIIQVPRISLEMRVTVVGASQIQVTRPFPAGSTDAQIASGEEFQIVGHAATEGATAPESVTTEPNIITQVCQEFRQPWELTDRARNTEVYGPEEWARQAQENLDALMTKVDAALLLSQNINVTDPFKTGGVRYWMSDNVFNIGGVLTEATWIADLNQWFRRNYGQQNLVMFAGSNMLGAMDGFGRDAIRYGPDDQILGIKAGSYQTHAGLIHLIPHGLMSPLGSATTAANYGYQGLGIGLNLKDLALREFRGGSRKLFRNIKTDNHPTSQKDEYTWTVGLYLATQMRQCEFKAVTG
jgi:hypothetical protein